jgi:hypothetical protein
MKSLSLTLFTLTLASCSVLVGQVKPVEEKSANSSTGRSVLERHGWKQLNLSAESDTGSGANDTSDSPDAAWQSARSTAVISLNSVCRKDKGRGRDLKQVTGVLLSQWDNLKVDSERPLTVGGLPAYETIATGDYLSSHRKFQILVVKSPSCIYDLIFVGPLETFDQEVSVFQEFRDSLFLK